MRRPDQKAPALLKRVSIWPPRWPLAFQADPGWTIVSPPVFLDRAIPSLVTKTRNCVENGQVKRAFPRITRLFHVSS